MKKGMNKDYIFECLEAGKPIENVEFEYAGAIDFINKNHNFIIFKNCSFNDKVFFQNISNCNSIEFYNCQFNEVVQFKTVENCGDLEFLDCNFHATVFFSEIDAPNTSAFFKNCTSKTRKLIHFDDLTISSLYIKECTFSKLFLLNSKISQVEIENSSIQGNFDILNLTSEILSLNNESVERKINTIHINSPDLAELEIDSVAGIQKIEFHSFVKAELNCSFGKFYLYTGSFELLSLGVTTFDKKKVNSRIDEFRVWDINQKGTIQINNLYINNLDLLNVDANFTTYSLNETVLVNTSIVGCIFSKFYCNQLTFINNPEIIKSDVSNFVINNLGWNNGKKLKDIEDFDSIPWFYNLRKKGLMRKEMSFDTDDIVQLRYHKDTYRQLKIASQRNGNNIDALIFHANEMRTYWKEIRITGGVEKQDRILIFLNRWTSNFGQSWLLPLLWIGILTGSYYFIVDQPNLSFYPNDWWNGFLETLNYLNPVRKIDADSSRSSQGLDVLFRILNAYFIYHFIKATRKFGKV